LNKLTAAQRSPQERFTGVCNRRVLMGCAFLGVSWPPAQAQVDEVTAESWITEALVTRASESPLKLQRFREPIWVLQEPIEWKPSRPSQQGFRAVVVPRHFVTDLASVPRVFWSLMPRDGVYAYPAIVHDYLYWDQSRPKAEADQILEWSMEDLEVSKAQVLAITQAVRVFGDTAWNDNTARRRAGERRILREPPPSAMTKWSEWKAQPERFIR
jgi:hypothetical protein